jgi:hypothetical protein
VFLQIEFNQEGARKLEEISKVYVSVEEPEIEDEEGQEQRNVSIIFDGQVYQTTHFGEEINTGILAIPMGTYRTAEEGEEILREASIIAITLNSGVFPIKYVDTYEGLTSRIGQTEVTSFIYLMIAIATIIFIILVIKFKTNGIYAFILGVGYTALLTFLIRIANIEIAPDGILGIILVSLINYIFIYMILNISKKEGIKVKEAMRNFILKFTIILIPLYIISVICIFATSINVSSFGGTVFWGNLLMYIYSIIFTKPLLISVEKGAQDAKK